MRPRRRLGRARHDGRDERDHRGQDRPQRLRHDRRLPRPARDRPPGPADALRHPVREDAAARPARPRGRRRRAARARRARSCVPLDEGSVRTRPRCSAARESTRSPSACSTPTSTPSTSAGSARSSPRSCPGVPVSLSAEVAPEFREYLRASTTVINAAIRPAVERYLERIEQRLERGRRPRQAARDAVERRRVQLGGGAPPAGLHGRVGTRGGRDRVRAARRGARPRGHPLLRHGRHDREGRPDPGRQALGDQGLPGRRPRRGRDRRHVALGLPGADARRRPRRDRRRRRLDRLGRLRRPAARRAAERRRRSRAASATGAAASSRP